MKSAISSIVGRFCCKINSLCEKRNTKRPTYHTMPYRAVPLRVCTAAAATAATAIAAAAATYSDTGLGNSTNGLGIFATVTTSVIGVHRLRKCTAREAESRCEITICKQR